MSRSNTKKKTLNQKFAFAFALLLVILFSVLLIAVQIIAQVYTNKYVENAVVSTHKGLQSEFTDVLNEINYGYTRIVQNERIRILSQNIPYEEKQSTFEKIIHDSALSNDYVNVVLCTGDDVFTLNDGFDLPTESFAKTLESGGGIEVFNKEIAISFSPYQVKVADTGISAKVEKVLDYGNENFALCDVSGKKVYVSVEKGFDMTDVMLDIDTQNVSVVEKARDIRLI